MRISPGEVMITSADALRSINSTRSRYKRGPFFTAFRFVPKRDNLFSIQNDAYHTIHRERMAPGVSDQLISSHVDPGNQLQIYVFPDTLFQYLGRENDGYDVSIDKQLSRLFDLIERKYVAGATSSEGRLLDFHTITHFFPLDVISDIALGQPFGYLDEGEDLYKFVAINGEFFIYAVTLACQPWIMNMLQKWPLKLLMPSDADVDGFGKIIRWVCGFLILRT